MIHFDSVCSGAREVVNKAVEFIRSQSKDFDVAKVELKSFNNLVSYVDHKAEQVLVQGLRNLIPDCGFITEENTARHKGEMYRWIIDPLDGTTNFVHGVPCFSVSVALMEMDEVVMGIVHEVNLNECFYSWKGSNVWCNESVIRVSKINKLSEALVATGFPYHDYGRLNSYMNVFDYCLKNTQGIRRPGSAATDLAWVAAGRFDVFYEYGLNVWDVAAGAFLVKQAGGKVCDFRGGDNYNFGKEIIAGTPGIMDEFTNMVGSYMNAQH